MIIKELLSMKQEDFEKKFLEVPFFVSRGSRPYVGVEPVKDKPPVLTKWKVSLVVLLVALIGSSILWL